MSVRPRLAALLLGGLSAVGVALCAAPPAIAADDPMTVPERSWIDLTGRVGVVGPSSFTLDYGTGSIMVDLDQYSRGAETARLATGDTVTVSGRVDADSYQRRSIEAHRVVVHGSGAVVGGTGTAGVTTAFGPPASGSAPVVSSSRLAAPAPIVPYGGVAVSPPVVSSGSLAAPAPGVVMSPPVVSSGTLPPPTPAPSAPVVTRVAPAGSPPVIASTTLPPAGSVAPRTADGYVSFTGRVGQIDGRTFILDTGLRQLVVEVGGLGYDPFDGRAARQLRQGDRVTVDGVLEAQLGTDGRLIARSLRYEPGPG